MEADVATVLTIEQAVSHGVTRAATAALTRAWQGTVGGRALVGRSRGAAAGPRVTLGLGSLVRPSVVVHFELPYEQEAAVAADRLALTTAAWDALGDTEAWRAFSAPLGTVPRLGRPDWMAPWVVVPGETDLEPAGVTEPGQLHVIGGWRPPPRGAVWWPSWPRAVAAVLGRAACVVGGRDPLVYDAIRAGVPVRPPGDGAGDLPERLDGALAGMVPPSLADDPRLWRHVARTAMAVHESGRSPAPLMTPEWVGWGRERIREQLDSPSSRWERLRRRHDKLRRDPRRFLADSRYAPLRAIGRAVFPKH